MPRIKRFNRNSKFRGNQFIRTRPNPYSSNNDSDLPTPSTSSNSPKKSSSYKKLNNSKLPVVSQYNNTNVHFIVNLEQVSTLIRSFSKCKFCDGTDCLEISLDDTFKSGIVHRMVLTCTNCQQFQTKMNSKHVNRAYELNLRYIYALRSIGKGTQAGRTFSAVMNMAAPTNKPNWHNKLILRAATDVCGASLRNAAAEAIEDNEGNRDVAAAFDGTWQKRGHTSMNGIVTVTSFDSGKVLDFECISKYCNFCAQGSLSSTPERKEAHKNSGLCTQTYSGSSGGMEVVGAKVLCARSEAKLGLRYTQYLGDGDSKGFAAVLESKPYGDNVSICKLECVGHIQKRVGTRLRKIKKENKGVKLSDGKLLAGKGRLTDEEIDQLQRYYGLAIRKNLESVEAMQKAIWATFFHKLSSDEKPQHQLCPNDSETWCQYNKHKQKDKKSQYRSKRGKQEE